MWRKLEEDADYLNLNVLVELFAFMRTTKVLLYIKNLIAENILESLVCLHPKIK